MTTRARFCILGALAGVLLMVGGTRDALAQDGTATQAPAAPAQAPAAETPGLAPGGTAPVEIDPEALPQPMEQLIERRMGPEQIPLELVQTTLLNHFGALGFVEIRNFRKEGVRYLAEALTPEGTWIEVVIDPVTGAVVAPQ